MSLVVLVRHVAIWWLHFRLGRILKLVLAQAGKLLRALLIVLVADRLQLSRLEYTLVGQLLYTPDEAVQVYADVVDLIMGLVHSMICRRMWVILVSLGNSRTKLFFSDFLKWMSTMESVILLK